MTGTAKMRLFAAGSAMGLLTLPVSGAGLTFWDNGPVNGVNGYSNASAGVFGFRRRLLDDFVLAPGSGAHLTGMHWNSVWGTPMGGAMGVGASISFRSDLAGTPGMVIATANVNSYAETATGNIFFSREEVTHWVEFDGIVLGDGHFWFEANVEGPENNFWLTADQQLNECWVNYDDLGGFQSGTDQFGVASDVNFVLTGVPVPGVLAVLAAGAIAPRRRRGP